MDSHYQYLKEMIHNINIPVYVGAHLFTIAVHAFKPYSKQHDATPVSSNTKYCLVVRRTLKAN
ncbi:hypothetical protein V1478_001544 [Vespula squamosa]|uniref:Uncharacterized protein n=1 Tax=Vespula squamosa TaxID=30214 RepID=A0ABD2C3J0_VESSQ